MTSKSEFRISAPQIKKNMVRQFNRFYRSLGEGYLNVEHIEYLKKLRDSIAMVLISSNNADLVDELLDVEEFYD